MSGSQLGERVIALGVNKDFYRTHGMKHELIENPLSTPIPYSEHIAEKILGEMRKGLSLVAICNQPDMPHPSTVMRWRERYAEFEDAYKLASVARARMRHEQAEQELEKLEYCDDKTAAYIADIRNRNRFRLMEIGSPNDYSPKLQMNHKVDGPLLNISLDLSTPQAISQSKTEIIEADQSSFQSQTDLKENQNTKSEQIEITVEKTEKA